MIRPITLISLALTPWHPSLALSQPSTDIYLVELGPGGEIEVGTLANVTTRQGYDNQPYFLPGGSAFLYTSIREDGQADAYHYDLPTGSSTRLTRTPESEYSPTPIPGWNAFSVVRVEADSAQRLWAFSLDGQVENLLLPDIEPVGYHAWSDSGTVALYVLGSPATLQLADLGSGESRIVADSVGRSLQRIPGGSTVSFVRAPETDDCEISELDPGTGEIRPLAPCLSGAQDHAWTPDGTLLMGSGSKIFAWRPGDEAWRELADLGLDRIDGITRLAVSPQGTHLAIVAAVPGS